ncbi:LacI family DNA-binding transcriptional regulator [Puniceicoccus vermicola]|uniref:LacI family DNA-binding transcriptional regulator n=1 Tax=Puniceicoccus vermicola TaxID=388746 RepID=A0A7X1AZ20_9BACT|nr:LacI family DNA-binding transcriptional regulator [Puniceicoccus vermicola]MBC2602592.1 LacI family DNA-binding transcriptional regulator [Puniceicoccus vermicola]
MSSPINIRDVAERAGVAVSTVSMALRNHPRISAKTRERVQQVARELGYRPNPLIAALMSNLRPSRPENTSPVIAILHAHPKPAERRRSPYYREIVQGASDQAEKLGYRIEEFWADSEDMTDARISDILRARGITGALIAPSHRTDRRWQLDWQHLSAATIGYTMESPQLHRACSHHFQGMCELFDRSLAQGYRKLGLVINREMDRRTHRQFRAAFLLEQENLLKKNRIPVLLQDKPGAYSFRRWMKRHRPDIVFGGGIEVLTWMKENDQPAPGDCGFALLDWNQNYETCTGINQQMRQISAAAIDMIIEMLQRNERGIPAQPRTLMIESRWNAGFTTRKIQIAPQ